MIALERRGGRPLTIGHRGAAALAPENTLASFRAALAAGVDLIELDVERVGSGELVVAHSGDLREVTHGRAEGRLSDHTLASARALAPDLPALADALRFFADEASEVGVHLDLKAPGAVEEVLAAAASHDLLERTFVTSFHRGALRRVAQLEPRVRTGVAFPNDRLGISSRRGSAHLVPAGIRVLRAPVSFLGTALLAGTGASALVLHHGLVTARVVAKAHARGVPVVAWTIQEPADLLRVDAAGVDAVVVDNPTIVPSTLSA